MGKLRSLEKFGERALTAQLSSITEQIGLEKSFLGQLLGSNSKSSVAVVNN
jgi:hypothetical protein